MASILDKEFHTIRDWPGLAMSKPYADVGSREKGLAADFATIDARVVAFEDGLIANAKTHAESMTALHADLDSVTDQLIDLAKAADRGEAVDLERWQLLDGKTQRLISQIERCNASTEHLIRRLEDPLEALADIQERFPALRGRPLT